MNYVIYHQETGEIVQQGSCPPSVQGRQAAGRFGYACVEGKGNRSEHVVIDGKVAKLPAAEIVARQAALDQAMELPPGVMSKEDRIMGVFQHLNAQGVDLGVDGAALVAAHVAKADRVRNIAQEGIKRPPEGA